jgi:hypothetical protein
MTRIIHHYRMREGVTGYRAGDVLHDRDTDTWALAVADGRGVALAPLTVRRRTGETGVGDWRWPCPAPSRPPRRAR